MIFETLQFRHSWRPYQKRVLAAIHEHLDDQRLHVVAAPGAGKTTLGLEVFRLLAKPAMVLSPTRIIRDQWLERLNDFCDVADVSQLDWISTDINNPKILTSITYQALYAKLADDLRTEDEYEEEQALDNDDVPSQNDIHALTKTIQSNNIQVLILDEAHHLRSQWWRALDKLCQQLPDLIVVSLTATPPYDVQGHEWQKYDKLCGPIDEEISVPELVKAGTLCAHQDFVWASNVTQSEKKEIKEHDNKVATVCKTLFDNETFNDIIESHPWLYSDNIEPDVIKEPEIAIALLSFLKEKHNYEYEHLTTLLDLNDDDIPELGKHWWQVLIESVFYSDTFTHKKEHQKVIELLKKQLRSSGLLHNRRLSLERSRRIEKSLSFSPSKIDSCTSIHDLESKHRGNGLRQVILTDYIRDESLQSGLVTEERSLGAWPIFTALTSTSATPTKLGLLTGRLSIISTSNLEALTKLLDKKHIKFEPLADDGLFVKVTGPLNQLTVAFTALLMNGDIHTLVGTRALLGEGWDAPAINSLILASSVGSFMLTNQMRGRAIRINPKEPQKVSSIWHLVAINSESDTGWSDYYNLRKRFDTFVGLSELALTIESGFDRLNATALESENDTSSDSPISGNNRQMLARYQQLDTIAQRWSSAITIDQAARVVPSVKTARAPKIRGHLLKHSFKYLLLQIAAVFGAVFTEILEFLDAVDVLDILDALDINEEVYSIVVTTTAIVIIAVLLYMLPQTISVIKILFRHLPVDGSLKQIGQALAVALCKTVLIKTPISELNVTVLKEQDGSFYVSLSGSTFYESSFFADCLAEIVAPIEKPRYLVVRKGSFLGIKRDDYHVVPIRLAIKKEFADIFCSAWNKYVSASELIYTRTYEGRKQLLMAKMRAFSATFKNDIKRQDRWQ